MALSCRVLQVFLAVLAGLATTSGTHAEANLTLRCHPDQAAALLELKKSFSFFSYPNPLESWQDDTDCCLWEGVGCSDSLGHVTALELGGRGIYSQGLDLAIFKLTSLQLLDLSMNNFGQYSLPTNGFERLTSLTHLNLSYSGFYGQIPASIDKLANLISLDLSTTIDDYVPVNSFYGYDTNPLKFISLPRLEEPNFEILVSNLSSLRELYLDEVDMSSSRDWYHALAKSLPRLRVLSLSNCGLSGPICPSLSTLHSLNVINLQHNFDMHAAPFPEIFMDFLNLSVLQLGSINLQGRFPRKTFESKTLRVLDLSGNLGLSGHVPNFSNASSLETMMLDWTSFSFGKPGSFSNFNSLQMLGLDVSFASGEPLSSLGIHMSLRHLELTQTDLTKDLGLILSWIGDLQNLASLELSGWNFSRTSFSSVAKLKNLKSLSINNCSFTNPSLPAIGNLVNLRRLVIIDCGFNVPIASAIGHLANLESLEIVDYQNSLGPIPSAIGNLSSLKSLKVETCCSLSTIPSAIGNLRSLKSLEITARDFVGQIPSSIGNLSSLISLKMSIYLLDIPTPAAIFNLSNLEVLDMSMSGFSGPIPYAVGRLKKLTSLLLRESSFSGSIPNSVFNLTQLIELDLSFNLLSGEIPTSIFTIPTLQHLDIRFNQLSGSIKDFDATSSRLVLVDLSTNNLTGFFPKSFFQLRSLAYLDIGWNNLVGSVDLSSFWRLENLAHLGLSHNNLSVMELDGEDKNSASTYLPRVTILGLASCNLMRFPSSLAHLNQMSVLDLSCNRISGAIPKWIWVTWNSSLTYLNLSHNLLSIMQLTSYVLPFDQLETLDLSFNQLQGQIPMPSPPAANLDYSNNSFSSVLPNFTLYLGNQFRISKNKISGHIPNTVCDSTIQVLDLSFNNFSGRIPSCLIGNGYTSVLSLRENQFEGVLPNNIKDQCFLHTLDLNNNNIIGQLPRTLTKCLQLEFLDIGNNHMVGTFPSWLGLLSGLRVLVMRSNRFYGSMGGDLHSDDKSGEYFSNLQILDVASNNFSGNLSLEWFGGLKSMMVKLNSSGEIIRTFNRSLGLPYQDTVTIYYKSIYRTFDKILTTLTAIDLSNNSFDGTIPGSLGGLISLHVLNMSGNAFTGDIPKEFGGMTQLESLDLSRNQLSGGIPEDLTNLNFLGMLNLRDNHLVGMIPRSGQFATFQNSSFEGNLGLCGLPLSNPCGVSPAPPSAAHAEKSSHVDVILFLFIGLGFGIGFAAAILMRWGRVGELLVKSARALRT
ncbi:hypothetical protein ZWY2020_031607 [Hordeum vulgare]|nr:hypothetical protein ZWY2020_031607 [Hordeum vulgare]